MVVRVRLAFSARDAGAVDSCTTTFTRKGSAEYGREAGKILVGWFTWFLNRLAGEPFNFKEASQELSSVHG